MEDFPKDINVGELWQINYEVWLVPGDAGFLIVTDIIQGEGDVFLVSYHFFNPPKGWSHQGYDYYDDFKAFYNLVVDVNK